MRQRGVALVVALVLLVVTSALAFSTLSGTRLSEKMAANAQHKSVAFEVAESGLASARRAGAAALIGAVATAPGDAPESREIGTLGAELTTDYDQELGGGAALELVDGSLTARYCGEVASTTGSGLDADESLDGGTFSMLVDVRAAVSTSGIGASVVHVERVKVPGTRLGRAAACTAP